MPLIKGLGFIGLGVMGGRMCRNLAKRAGVPVMGFDIDPAKAQALADDGVTRATSIAELVDTSDLVFMCLPGAPQVRAVCFADDGLIHHARRGQTVVDMTTATVGVDREAAGALAQKGVDFADAPVARGVPSAEDGTLAITVGADEQVFSRIEPYLRCMGTEISHCGEIGTGQVLKLMNNMLVFQTVSALAEAMAIATRAGVDRTKVFDILARGSADSFVMRRHGACMTKNDYPDDWFPITYSLKDMSYALALAESVNVDAKTAKVAAERLEQAAANGWGHLYSPAIYKLFEQQ
ncbi:MAG: NAD-binding protein [Gammaproteobacteria bacterium]|nr:NAD-binding protein [Gammaproteobacteria bacterium]